MKQLDKGQQTPFIKQIQSKCENTKKPAVSKVFATISPFSYIYTSLSSSCWPRRRMLGHLWKAKALAGSTIIPRCFTITLSPPKSPLFTLLWSRPGSWLNRKTSTTALCRVDVGTAPTPLTAQYGLTSWPLRLQILKTNNEILNYHWPFLLSWHGLSLWQRRFIGSTQSRPCCPSWRDSLVLFHTEWLNRILPSPPFITASYSFLHVFPVKAWVKVSTPPIGSKIIHSVRELV